MGDYTAVLAYLGVALVAFVIALLWQKYRKAVVRRFRIEEYRQTSDGKRIAHHN
ncbi:MAG TPA: hypothetical protein VIH56_03245 [Candidatus Acidoferrales bacterium]